MIRLIIDTMGGDNSPGANIEGALNALADNPDLHIIFTGDEEVIKRHVSGQGLADASRIDIVHAPDVITGEDKPTDAIRMKKESSMMKGIRLLREKKPDTRVVVGGAVMTQEYADAIGADCYAPDAMATVHYAEKIFG